jgi:hypothetical protein
MLIVYSVVAPPGKRPFPQHQLEERIRDYKLLSLEFLSTKLPVAPILSM